VTLHGGEPIPVSADTTAVELTEAIRRALVELTEQVQRAYPAPAAGEPDWWQPAYLGGSAPPPDRAREIEIAVMQERLARKQQKAAGKGRTRS
jgi:hypothetical protein